MDFDPIADAKELCAKWQAETDAFLGRSTAQRPAAVEVDPLEGEVERAYKQTAYAEQQAVALDQRLRAIATMGGIPAEYLSKPRSQGVLRNPFGGPFANNTVVMALQSSQHPDAARLIPLLCERAGIPAPAIDYAGIERKKQRAIWDSEMAQMTAELKASREKALAEYNARLQQGTPKVNTGWKQGVPFPEHLRTKR
ncbi:hypothetical protein [Cyanobium gracile]|uniref:Uncharacterized protein n=1 Tax=Cyanobium gracile (strain ATCC 27147 / PCC 6307) TaxID=292564 RepID=K9P862_CYAGP|nr:hypothetical protein [Cyanobium gracile]AFY29602.1 hypothetical protein Cyagr_2496 [Cyanobium gracile PCC 6307]